MNKAFTASLLLAVCGVVTTPDAVEAQIWANWSLPSSCTGSVTGSFGAGSVSYAGGYSGVQDASGADCGGPISNPSGDDYFSPTSPYSPLPTNQSFIQLIGQSSGTITFGAPVAYPYLALISVGQSGNSITYSFNKPFSVVSDNTSSAAYWGTGSYFTTGNSITGTEFSGVLKFEGTFNSLTFSTGVSENWHGFTVGADDFAGDVVPEPTTFALMLSGLIGVAGIARLGRSA